MKINWFRSRPIGSRWDAQKVFIPDSSRGHMAEKLYFTAKNFAVGTKLVVSKYKGKTQGDSDRYEIKKGKPDLWIPSEIDQRIQDLKPVPLIEVSVETHNKVVLITP